jgi:hypothetical protein
MKHNFHLVCMLVKDHESRNMHMKIKCDAHLLTWSRTTKASDNNDKKKTKTLENFIYLPKIIM